MSAPGRRAPSSLGTWALLLVFALLGAGAALLAGHAPAIRTGTQGGLQLAIPSSIWAVLFLAPLLVGFTAYVVRWAITSPAGMPARVGVSVAVAALVAMLLIGLLFTANWNGQTQVTVGPSGTNGSGASGPTGTGHNGTTTNNTTGNTSTGNGTSGGGGGSGPGGNGSTNGSSTTGNSSHEGNGSRGGGRGNNTTGTLPVATAPTGGASFDVSNILFLFIAGGLSAVVAVLALPGIIERIVDRRPRSYASLVDLGGPPGAAEVRSALREAALAIEAGETPRESIVRLYGRLVGWVSPHPNDLTAATAQEIQRTRLRELRVAPARSEALTRLFEEACYSDHPIGGPDATRFVETMRAVERDLYLGGAAE
ncbi:MAG TPA: DUF4129 domain-containing protein [Thermoplasmata archaeon]|nr:DUF4129 domain-containing protein [Thermoplasmata archaeon]